MIKKKKKGQKGVRDINKFTEIEKQNGLESRTPAGANNRRKSEFG